MRSLAALALALLLVPLAHAEPILPPTPTPPRAALTDHRDGTYTVTVTACDPPLLADCVLSVRLLPRAPGVFPVVENHGVTVYTSLDCQHHAPTYGVRDSQCSSVSLSPTARVTPVGTSDGWFYFDAKVCAHYTGWTCAWWGAVPVPDPRAWPNLVQPHARANADGSFTVGETCHVNMPWPVNGQSCSASVTAAPDFLLVEPQRTWDGFTTHVYACRARASTTTPYTCTYAGQSVGAHAAFYEGPDGSLDPDVRVCLTGTWCPVAKRVDLPKVLP